MKTCAIHYHDQARQEGQEQSPDQREAGGEHALRGWGRPHHHHGPPRQSDPSDGYDDGGADDDDAVTGFILSISQSGMSHLILKGIVIHTFEFLGFL